MDDRELRDAVLRELERDPALDPTHVGVAAADGAITLTGHVVSYPQKVAAVRAAERVDGVQAVADDVRVDVSSSGKHGDSQIAEEIARKRRRTAWIPDSVEVEVANGHVTLRGEVEREDQRGEAEQAVRQVRGVRKVKNALEVKPAAAPDAAERRIAVAGMPRARHLLLCYDGSTEGERALERVVDAAAAPVRVTIVSVVEPLYRDPRWSLADPAEEEVHRRLLDEAARSFRRRGVTALTAEPIGDVAASVVDVARELEADLIVVGSRQRGIVRRLLFGSVSAELVVRAPCDVLVVR